MNKIKYASVRPFWIATANVLLFENVHYAVNCSEVLDLNVHASFINAAIHLTVKMLQFSYSVSKAQHMLLWSPYVIGQTIIFSSCFFLLLFLSFFLSSPNLSGRRLDVYYTLAHGVALVRI